MLSDTAYRMKAEEKRQRESKLLQKIPRLDSYFSTKAKLNRVGLKMRVKLKFKIVIMWKLKILECW